MTHFPDQIDKFEDTQWIAPPRLSPSALEIWEKSKKNGWSVVVSKDTQKMQMWHYTVGLWEHYRHPELLISGLALKEGVAILNKLSQKIKEGHVMLTLEQLNKALEGVIQNNSALPKISATQLYSLPPSLIQIYLKMVGVFNPFWQTEALEIVHESIATPSQKSENPSPIQSEPLGQQLSLYKLPL